MARVPGWSGPSTLAMSGARASNNASALRASPDFPVQKATLLRVVRVPGAEHPGHVGRQGLEQRQRLAGVARLPGPAGGVVAGGEGAVSAEVIH
ncbi:MAG: hypothetical protein ACR2KK_01850 [Acidimicrobiales bacterium]